MLTPSQMEESKKIREQMSETRKQIRKLKKLFADLFIYSHLFVFVCFSLFFMIILLKQ